MSQTMKGFRSLLAYLDQELPKLRLAYRCDTSDIGGGYKRVDIERIETIQKRFLWFRWTAEQRTCIGKLVTPEAVSYWPTESLKEGDQLEIKAFCSTALPKLHSLAEKLQDFGFPTEVKY